MRDRAPKVVHSKSVDVVVDCHPKFIRARKTALGASIMAIWIQCNGITRSHEQGLRF
jgi:hypothetical protein